MSQIPVTIKIDAQLKQEAQQLAKSLGLSLSAIVENKLRQVVRERRVVFEEDPPAAPSKRAAKSPRPRRAKTGTRTGQEPRSSTGATEEAETIWIV